MAEVVKRGRGWFAVGVDIVTLAAVVAAGLVWWNGRAVNRAPAAQSAVGREWAPPPVNGPLLVYVFRSDCPVCKTQLPIWKVMAQSADSAGWRVAAFTPEALTDDIRGYFGWSSGIGVNTIDPARLASLAIHQVPTTLVVDAYGVVRFHRVGVFTANAAELAETL